MKKIKTFFSMLIVMIVMFASLFFAGAIFDAEQKTNIETYFFQPNS